MKRTVSGMVLSLLFVAILASASVPASSYVNVNVSEAKQMIDSNPELVILDVRTRAEYDSGHIQNATLIPVNELASRLSELDKQKETLVYCASGGRSATASQMLVDNGFSKVYNMLGGITAWKGAGYWIEIIHNGDLLVDGTQTLVIENCIYIQNGNLYVSQFAELSLENAELVFDMQYDAQYFIRVEDYATVEVDNSTIKFKDWWGVFNPSGHATVRMNNSMLDYGVLASDGNSQVMISSSTIHELVPSEASQVVFENSTEIFLVDLIFDSQQAVHLDGLETGYQKYWNLHENETVQNVLYDLTVKDSTVAWGLKINDDAAVEVSNSEIERFMMNLYRLGDIRNLTAGYVAEWSFNSIRLGNSYVKTWSVAVYGASVSLENCEIYGWITGNCSISIANSRIEGHIYTSSLTIGFDETIITWYLAIVDSNVYVYGNVTFSLQTLSFASSNLTRNYNIVTENNDYPAGNAALTLYDGSYKVIWNGTTDSLGKADFNLTFTESNCTDALKLEAVKGNLSIAHNITFLSDTPVILQFGVLGDVNGDLTVDIYDAIVLASAYNAKPESPNWNSSADLNSDNVVDIYDAILLANNYGKTT